MEKTDGGAAFPRATEQTVRGYNGTLEGERGMTLRQWYKGMAIAGALVATRLNEGMVVSPEGLASACSKYADAMIAEDEKFEAGK